jgi:hypothetical protein
MPAMTTSLPKPCVSPLLLADRMLTLAQQADGAGLSDTAGRLVLLAHRVLDEPTRGRAQLTTKRGAASRAPVSSSRSFVAIAV